MKLQNRLDIAYDSSVPEHQVHVIYVSYLLISTYYMILEINTHSFI